MAMLWVPVVVYYFLYPPVKLRHMWLAQPFRIKSLSASASLLKVIQALFSEGNRGPHDARGAKDF